MHTGVLQVVRHLSLGNFDPFRESWLTNGVSPRFQRCWWSLIWLTILGFNIGVFTLHFFFLIFSQAFLPSSPVTPTAVLFFADMFSTCIFFLCYHRMHSTSGVSGTGTRLDLIEWTLTGARTGNCFFVLIWHCMVMVIKQGVESGKHYQGVIVLGAVHFSFFSSQIIFPPHMDDHLYIPPYLLLWTDPANDSCFFFLLFCLSCGSRSLPMFSSLSPYPFCLAWQVEGSIHSNGSYSKMICCR